MILKAKTSIEHGAWRYFEADEVQVFDGGAAESRIEGVNYHDFDSGHSRGFVTVSFLGKCGQPTEITSDMDIYLLNESGQTIDRIN